MTHKQIFNLVTTAIFTALIMLMSLVQYLGYIEVGVVSITLIHIPVILGAMILPFFYGMWLGFVFGVGSLVASFMYGKTPIDLLFQNPAVAILPRMVFAESVVGIKYLISKFKDNKIVNLILLFILVAFIFTCVILIPNRLIVATGNTLPQVVIYSVAIILLLAGSSMISLLLYYGLVKNKLKFVKSSIVPIISTIVHTTLVILLITIFSNNILINNAIKQALSVFIILNASVETLLATLVVPPLFLTIQKFFNRGKYDLTI